MHNIHTELSLCCVCFIRVTSMAEYQRRKREEEEGRAGKEGESQKFFAGGSEHRSLDHLCPFS